MMMKRTLMAGALLAAAALPAAAQTNGPKVEAQGGKAVFDHLCAACHMPGGVGVPGAFPALAKNPKLAGAAFPIFVILNGQNAMPAVGGMLSDQQIADVVNYVRSDLNAYKPATTPAEVAAARH